MFNKNREEIINNVPWTKLAAFMFITWPVALTCLLLLISGTVTVFYYGIGVDSFGKVYVGTVNDIEVYENCQQVDSICPKTSRGYVFTVQNNDTILLSTGSKIYELDLNGEVISEASDETTATYEELELKKNTYVASDGNTYRMVLRVGRAYVIRDNGEVVYKMPILDYIVKIAFFLWGLSMVIFIPYILFKTYKGIHKTK